MPKLEFDALPDNARLWVFGADRDLDDEEERALLSGVDSFLEGWKAHGVPLSCARQWHHGRFLLIAVDPASEPPSGCSIDAMVRRLKELERDLDVVLVDSSPVWWRDEEGAVRRSSRPEFKRLALEGEVGPDTLVWDGSVSRVEELRRGRWERPAGEGWHARAFFGSAASRAAAPSSRG